jgi:orotidine-5'-phosphate decarboxylase
MSDAASRVIVALDCDEAHARVLARQLSGHALWLKVGMTLFYQAGPGIVRDFADKGFKVFVDLKLHDIPHQVHGAAAALAMGGASMMTVHAIGGQSMMVAARAGVDESCAAAGTALVERPKLIAVTVLTSIDTATLAATGVTRTLSEQAADLAAQAVASGLDGIVCSPREAEMMRGVLGAESLIVTPGVRPMGSARDDQVRTATPAIALRAGASHLVIGRPITQSDDPAAAFDTIVHEVMEVH